MNILVTGGAGYLGSVLMPKLLIRGHKIRVVDVGYFGMEHLQSLRPTVEFIREDLRLIGTNRQLQDQLFEGIDCVIHLAAISNDPSADLNPELTKDINLDATVELAKVCRERGVRLLFSSSCSVYGEADGELDETSPTGPLTTYAVSKLEAEQKLMEMSTDQWRPIILRNGTLYGYSPRMRFDLVINIFALYSCMAGEIHVFGGGKQWRPFIHVADCARAFVFLAEQETLRYQIYNVSHQNLRVADVADRMEQMVPHLKVLYQPQLDPDSRDYRVVHDRLSEVGFQPRITVEMGVEQMIEAIF